MDATTLWKNDHGILKQDVLYEPDGTQRRLHVYLPADYNTSTDRYPVMYFFDGHNLFRDTDATYGKSWGLTAFLSGWSKKMIVVGMECSHQGNDRLKEYCPYHVCNDFFGDLHGTGKETCRWLTEKVKPMIDRDFRTWSHREATGIAGSSMGGLMSLYAVIRHNQVFSKAACLSSSIGACMTQLQKDIADTAIQPDTRVFLSWGTREGGQQLDQWNLIIDESLQEKGVMTSLFRQKNGRHCEADWERQVSRFMNYLWLNH